MSSQLDKISEQVLQLSSSDRAALAERIWKSLDDMSTNAHDAEWIQEAIRRRDEIESGSAELLTHDETMLLLNNALNSR